MTHTTPAFSFSAPQLKLPQRTHALSSSISTRADPLSTTSFITTRRKKACTIHQPPQTRQAPKSQLIGNVEDLPLEKIPSDPEALPTYWSRPGVYGIYSSESSLQFVAAVADVRKAIAVHVRMINNPNKVHAVRMITVNDVDEAPLGMFAENWVMAHVEYGPGPPPGNTDSEPIWRETDEKPENVYFAPDVETELAETEIKRILRGHRVVLFMKGTRREPKCGFSKSVVDALEETGEHFVCVDCLDEIRNKGLREEIKSYSKWPTIPQLYVDGDFVGGADIVRSMQESGELPTVVKAKPKGVKSSSK